MSLENGVEDWELQSVRITPEREPASVLPPRACHTHPDRAAPFRCAGCEQLLCAECAPEKLMSGELVRFCSLCGGVCAEIAEDTHATPTPADALPAAYGAPRKPSRRLTPLPEPQPEPPPTDRQLFSILIHPFKGLGAVWVVFWWVLNLAAWPVALLFFVPYLWSLYLSVERAKPRVPGIWSLGGDPWHVTGRWMKLLISPGLPAVLCYVLLTPGRAPVPTEPGAPTASTGILATIGAILVCALAVGLPLMLSVLFRTGSPFKSLDPVVLISLIRRSPSRYLACLVSLVVLGAFALGIYLLAAPIPVPKDLPGLAIITRPVPALALAGLLAIVWGTVALGRYGRWVSWCLDEE